ncbi:UDP-glucose 4-epimerase [Salinibacter ruber]|nr:UDP-glucose 4-epimerase [Salinibacter ruber]
MADALLGQGHTVHVIDDLSTGRRRNVPAEATLFEQDIRSEAAAGLMAEHEYELLVHHAAQMDVRKSVDDPGLDADVNIRGLLNLMEAGVENGLQKVIFASTGGAIYGEPEYTPQDLAHPLRPVSPYGVAKLAAEKYLHYYQHQYGVEAVALRYANVYGPRQNPHGEAGVVAIFARQLLTGEQPVVYGDGEQTRDYVYVGDVARANLAALSHQGSGVFNVGTERETSVNELFGEIRVAAGVDVSKEHAPAKPGEQQRSVLGVEQSRTTLGWEPQVSLEQGLRRTVDWFRDNLS